MKPAKAILSGAVLAAIAVVLGAFAAHALKNHLPQNRFDGFETGVRYHLYHALALVVVGVLAKVFPEKDFRQVQRCFVWGVMLFSGSLYLLALQGLPGVAWFRCVWPLTPAGGVLFIAGWLVLAYSFIKK